MIKLYAITGEQLDRLKTVHLLLAREIENQSVYQSAMNEAQSDERKRVVELAKAIVDTTIKMLMFSDRDIMFINLNQGSAGLAKESNDKLKILSREINRQIESINQLP